MTAEVIEKHGSTGAFLKGLEEKQQVKQEVKQEVKQPAAGLKADVGKNCNQPILGLGKTQKIAGDGIRMVNTRELLLDYMKHRLENAGYDLLRHDSAVVRRMFGCVGPLTASTVTKILIDLASKIDTEHSNKHFIDRPVAALNLSDATARAGYFAWLNELFKDKTITWGRLALVLVFTARLTEKAMMESEFMRVHNIVDWCCQYFVYNMFDEWIVSSGGWEHLPPVDTAKTLSLLKRLPDRETVGYSTLALIAAFTVGLLMTRSQSV